MAPHQYNENQFQKQVQIRNVYNESTIYNTFMKRLDSSIHPRFRGCRSLHLYAYINNLAF